jgi:hypothetical protein
MKEEIKNNLWSEIFIKLHDNVYKKPNTQKIRDKACNIVKEVIDEISCLELFAVNCIKIDREKIVVDVCIDETLDVKEIKI